MLVEEYQYIVGLMASKTAAPFVDQGFAVLIEGCDLTLQIS